jgi:hypothetical protein
MTHVWFGALSTSIAGVCLAVCLTGVKRQQNDHSHAEQSTLSGYSWQLTAATGKQASSTEWFSNQNQ